MVKTILFLSKRTGKLPVYCTRPIHCMYWIGIWRSPSRRFHFYMQYLRDLYNHQSFVKFTYITWPPHVCQTLKCQSFDGPEEFWRSWSPNGGLDEVRSSPKGSSPSDLILTSIWSSTSSRTWKQYDLIFVSRKKSVQCKLRSQFNFSCQNFCVVNSIFWGFFRPLWFISLFFSFENKRNTLVP